MQRYRLNISWTYPRAEFESAEMAPDPAGEWVRHEDVARLWGSLQHRTIGQLRRELERFDSLATVWTSDGRAVSAEPLISHRGNYHDLAIRPHRGDDGFLIATAGDLARMLADIVGRHLQGYKGGAFQMREDTAVYFADYGEVGAVVVGVVPEDERVRLILCREW